MKEATWVDYQARIDQTLRWIAEHQREDITPADVARVAHFSPYHFHRIFRGVSGESVMQCVRRLRLESAALRLRRGNDSVIEVALDAGFDSHEGFTRAFKDHFGAPPQEWRHTKSERLLKLSAVPIPEVERRAMKAMSFVCMSHRGSFAEVGEVWDRFIATALAEGIFTGTEQLVGRYPDDPDITPAGKVRYDVGLLSERVPQNPVLRRESIPAGTWAVTLHRGSYKTLSDTYLNLVGGWFPKHGIALADGPCLEFYLNSPATTPEAELLTELWAPLG